MRGSGAKAWGALALVVAVVVALTLLDASTDGYETPLIEDVGFAVVTVVTGVFGFLLAHRVPGNPIGWLLLAQAFVFSLSGLADTYAAYGLVHDGSQPGSRLAAVWDTNGWPSLFAPLVALIFVFPDGRLPPGRRWRHAAIVGVIAFAVAIVAGMLGDEPLDPPFESVEPYGILPKALTESVKGLSLLGMIATLVLAVLSMRSRFRRAGPVERSQLKWLFYASTLVPVAIVCGTIDGLLLTDAGDGPLTGLSFVLAAVAIPFAIWVAVTRHRLYDVDRLISATVLYALLTLLLAGTFVAIILVGAVALGGGSPFTTAAATLAVTLAFRPLRSRLQSGVDRRFNRARYEALQEIDDFLERLRAGAAEPEEIEGVLARALEDPSLMLFFWIPDADAHADSSGHVGELPPTPAGRTPVTRGKLRLGTLVHDEGLDAESGSIAEVIVHAGLAIEVARLRVEVRRQLAEVEASRARIASATHEERRRLERDLHDGAQQRLVSIGLDLRHLQQGLEPGDAAQAGLDDAVGGLTDAITELRELARGVRPGMLDEGLARALGELAARSPVRTEVDATNQRFPDEIEAAAYFVASEALANAAKHAAATTILVRAVPGAGSLLLTIRDDGSGGAAATNGSGLTGLADRVEALGGRLSVESPAGAGTELRAEFPCG